MNFEGVQKQGAFFGSNMYRPWLLSSIDCIVPPLPVLKKTRETPATLCFTVFKHTENAQILKKNLSDVV